MGPHYAERRCLSETWNIFPRTANVSFYPAGVDGERFFYLQVALFFTGARLIDDYRLLLDINLLTRAKQLYTFVFFSFSEHAIRGIACIIIIQLYMRNSVQAMNGIDSQLGCLIECPYGQRRVLLGN